MTLSVKINIIILNVSSSKYTVAVIPLSHDGQRQNPSLSQCWQRQRQQLPLSLLSPHSLSGSGSSRIPHSHNGQRQNPSLSQCGQRQRQRQQLPLSHTTAATAPSLSQNSCSGSSSSSLSLSHDNGSGSSSLSLTQQWQRLKSYKNNKFTMYIYDANLLTERVSRCCFVKASKYGGSEFVFLLSASKTTRAPISKETLKPKLQFLIES